MKVSLGIIIFTYLLSLNAFGFFDGEVHYKWWKDRKIVNEMELSDQQADKIEKIFASYKGRIIAYQKQLKKKEAELSDNLRKPECSKEEVLKITDDVQGLKSSLTRIKIEMFLQVKSVLTPKQEEILHNINTRYKRRSR